MKDFSILPSCPRRRASTRVQTFALTQGVDPRLRGDDKIEDEKRCSTRNFEIKSLSEDGVFAGYASVFGIIDSQSDIVEAGAFAEATARQGVGVKLLWQHDVQQPIGTIRRLSEDPFGLYIEAQLLLNVTRGAEAHALLKAGAVQGLSIGFTPVKYRIDPSTGIRHLKAVRLWEVSLVTFPANEVARVTVVKAAPKRSVFSLNGKTETIPAPQAIRLADALIRARKALEILKR